MIVFEKIRYKNFLAAGEQFIEIPLNDSDQTLFIGRNGAGKSTILDALVFVLYGKPFRDVNKNQLINSINGKGTLTEVEFSIGSNSYMVRRGIKPNKLEIYENGELVEQDGSATEYQKYLEKHILKMSQKSFTQVVILGSSSFVPFMKLSTPDRRQIVEDLLDIEIFTHMNTVAKDKVKTIKTKLSDIKNQMNDASGKLKVHETYQQDIQSNNAELIEEKLAAIEYKKEEIEVYKESIEIFQDELEELEEDIKKVACIDKIREVERKKLTVEGKIEDQDIKIAFYKDHDECDSCKQEIHELHKNQMIVEAQDKKEKAKAVLKKLENALSILNKNMDRQLELEKDRKKIEDDIRDLTIKSKSLKDNIKDLESDVIKLKLKDKESKDNKEKEINELKTKLKDLNDKEVKIKKLNEYFEFILTLLKDNGIKTQIIKQYLPLMNDLINGYLERLEFPVGFTLDENFNETILSRYRDSFTYNSFSEGQKQRIDLALLLAWREVAALKNSVNTNLLIFDEVFDSSLDTVGTTELTKILQEFNGKNNIIVISHKGEELFDLFDKIYEFSEYQEFSKMEEKA